MGYYKTTPDRHLERFAEEMALLQLVTGSEVFAGADGDPSYVTPYFGGREYGSHEPANAQARDEYFRANAVMLQSYLHCKSCVGENRSGHHTIYIYCLPHIEITDSMGLIFPQHYVVEVSCDHLSNHDMRGVCFRTFGDVVEYLVKFLA